MDVVRLTTSLAAHIGRFDCYVGDDKSLRITGRRNPVGTVDGSRFPGSSFGDVRIKSLVEDFAPDYLQPLVGREFDTEADLLRAVHKVAFLNEVQIQLGRAAEDTLNELARIKPPGREPDDG